MWDFSLSPLTVLCGSNGAGKTSLLKSLLLLKQSQSQSQSSKANRGYLKFVGKHVDLGNYDSLVSYFKKDSNIEMSLRNSDLVLKEIYNHICKYAGIEECTEDKQYVDYDLDVRFVFSRSVDSISDNVVKRKLRSNNDCKKVNGSLLEAYFSILINNTVVLDWHVISANSVENNKSIRKYYIHIPYKYFEFVRGDKFILAEEADENGYISLEVLITGILPDAVWGIWKDDHKSDNKNNSVNVNKNKIPLPPLINTVISDLTDRLNGLHHIGPLRAPGQRYYIASEDEVGLDSSGEFLPYILRDRKESIVYNCFPDKHWKCEDVKLIDAVNYWLHYFRTGKYQNKSNCKKELKVNIKESLLVNFDLKNQKGDQSFSLIDSGFGYSQVLPIIVKCLLADFDDTLLIEQPELHLNPSLQVRLAEFFVAMSTSFRQIIIETHSEHIVNAIRVLSAESLDETISDSCKIYYLSNNDEQPVVHKLSINADGTVPNWPKEFFGEALTLTGRLLRAQKQLIAIKKEKK